MPETIGAGIGSCCAEMKKPPAVSARARPKKKTAQSHTDFATRNRKDKIERQQRKKKERFWSSFFARKTVPSYLRSLS
jgi:hypothetical protein